MKKMSHTILCVMFALFMTLGVYATEIASSEAPGTVRPSEDFSDGVWDGQSDGGEETPPEQWVAESHEDGQERRITVIRADGKNASVELNRPDEAVIWAVSYNGQEQTLDIQEVTDNQVSVSASAEVVKLFPLDGDWTPLGRVAVASFQTDDAPGSLQEAVPAGADPADGGIFVDGLGSWLSNGSRYNIISAIDTTYALDLNGNNTYNGSNIQLYKSNWGWAQDFTIRYVKYQNGKNWYKIVHTQSGKVLDVNASDWNPNTGNNVILYQYHGGNNQLWSFQRSGSGYRIQSLYNTNFYLDACGGVAGNYTNIWVYPKNSSRAQLWYLDNVTEPQIRFVDGNNWPISRYYLNPGSSSSVKFQFRGYNPQSLNAYTSPSYNRLNGFRDTQAPNRTGDTGYGYLNLYRPGGDWNACYVYLRLKANGSYRNTTSLYLP